jgi:HlyD family secretion protein
MAHGPLAEAPETGLAEPRGGGGAGLATRGRGQGLPVPAAAGAAPEPVPPDPRRPFGERLRRWRWRLAWLAALLALAAYALAPRLLGPVVAAEPVVRGALVQSVVATGRVETPHRVNVASRVTGTVAEVPVREGQAVEAGRLLVALDDGEERAAVGQAEAALAEAEARLRQVAEVTLPAAEASLRQAEANLLNARQRFERAQRLRGGGIETQAGLDDARMNLDVAEARARAARLEVASAGPGGTGRVLAQSAVGQARAGLAAARARMERTRIAAPAAGTLIGRDVEPGWVVQPGQVLMVLAPAGETEVVVQIDERNLGLVAVGQRALASADAYPDRRFEAVLRYLNPAVDPQRASVEAKLSVPSPPDYLRQDMTVSVDIAAAERADALVLPVAAVRDAAGPEPWVLRVEEGRARRRPVRVGLRGPQRVEILEGLREGDLVVPATAPVADGGRVRTAAIP